MFDFKRETKRERERTGDPHFYLFWPQSQGREHLSGQAYWLTAYVFPHLYFDTLATCLKWLMFHFCKYLRKSERTDTNCWKYTLQQTTQIKYWLG